MYENLNVYIPEIFDTAFARKKYAEVAGNYWWHLDWYRKRINYLKGCLKQMEHEHI